MQTLVTIPFTLHLWPKNKLLQRKLCTVKEKMVLKENLEAGWACCPMGKWSFLGKNSSSRATGRDQIIVLILTLIMLMRILRRLVTACWQRTSRKTDFLYTLWWQCIITLIALSWLEFNSDWALSTSSFNIECTTFIHFILMSSSEAEIHISIADNNWRA